MRVKINGKWHDSNKEPICIQVSEGEQLQIANMGRGEGSQGKYAIFPDKSLSSDADIAKDQMIKAMEG